MFTLLAESRHGHIEDVTKQRSGKLEILKHVKMGLLKSFQKTAR
jgi:hypothetical protein